MASCNLLVSLTEAWAAPAEKISSSGPELSTYHLWCIPSVRRGSIFLLSSLKRTI